MYHFLLSWIFSEEMFHHEVVVIFATLLFDNQQLKLTSISTRQIDKSKEQSEICSLQISHILTDLPTLGVEMNGEGKQVTEKGLKKV